MGEKKMVVAFAVMAAAVVLSFGIFRFLNQRKTEMLETVPEEAGLEEEMLPEEGTEQEMPAEGEESFSKAGVLLDSNPQSGAEGWTLVYSEEDQPELTLSLVFGETSLCDFGEGEAVCDNGAFETGTTVSVEGTKSGETLIVAKMTKSE